MSFRDTVLKNYEIVASWTPDPEDLYDYAMNVEYLYKGLIKVRTKSQALDIARDIIDDYQASVKSFPERQYKGDEEELAEYIMSQEE